MFCILFKSYKQQGRTLLTIRLFLETPYSNLPICAFFSVHCIYFNSAFSVLKELCYDIHQNWDSGNRKQIDWHLKITAPNYKRTLNQHSKYKRRHGWTNLKRIEMDWKLVSLTVFQSSFCLSAAFDIMLGGPICLTRSSGFVICKFFFLANPKFHWG